MGAKHSSKGINPQHNSMRLLQLLSLFCRREYRGRETVVDIVMHSSNPLQEWKAYFQLLEVLPEDCLLMSAFFGDCQCLRKLPCLRSCLLPAAAASSDWSSWGYKDLTPLSHLEQLLKAPEHPVGDSWGLHWNCITAQLLPLLTPASFLSHRYWYQGPVLSHRCWYQGISLVCILYANLCFRVCFLGNLTSNKDKVIYCTSQLVSGRGDIWT